MGKLCLEISCILRNFANRKPMNLLKNMTKAISILSFIIGMIMFGCNAKADNSAITVVAPEEFQSMLNNDSSAYLLDVRKPEEFNAGHLRDAHLLNWLDTADFKHGAEGLDKSKTIYVYCRSGRRSNEAANYLADKGFRVVDMEGGILAWEQKNLPVVSGSDEATSMIEAQGIGHESFTTRSGKDLKIHLIKHASLIVEVDGKLVYIDPTGMFGHDFSKLPKANAVMVTHEHHDHFDTEAINAVATPSTRFVVSRRVAELAGKGDAIAPGDTTDLFGFTVTATPAYNTTEDHLQFHPKERKDVGFIFDIDGVRIYVAGDTEDIPEMADMGDIDIAFLPVNQPFTMTPTQAIHAIEMLQPRIVYPYHYVETDLTPIVDAFKDNDRIDVRIRNLQ